MKKIFLVIISLSLLLIGCENKSTSTKNISQEDNTKKYYSYYTGKECSDSDNDKPSFMTIIENSPQARPQSGLSSADIIYETSAEGGIPRFIALFHDNSPEIIGPIRSVRPYFLDIVKEFNLPFAHCGGSEDALNRISKDKNLMSINEIAEGPYFQRDNSRKAPHNLYTSSNNINKYINDKNIKIQNKPFLSFDNDYYKKSSFTDANNLSITINKNYTTSYTYKDGLYTKSMDGKESIDVLNNTPLTFSNIVIQKTNINLSNDNLHLNIDLIGKGEGHILSQGKVIDVTWEKTSDDSRTVLYDKSGSKVPLSPGKTIWHIIDNKSNLSIGSSSK
ncbi:DUF3048 domain-containing protein [Clostridium sp. SHJSY1]|uniref:DUF3048 domain-containing protein n=1 Tax=Clostridium sp. SHJSY1 TaxID=2942483 RepID=UPI00287423D7|nr:DUF3048 domain-containing protein [Clostridium sp. SHJSY1]MDS0525327.1 DUF3048 domain-containing protein [Clostridium sp. SHJSY1]